MRVNSLEVSEVDADVLVNSDAPINMTESPDSRTRSKLSAPLELSAFTLEYFVCGRQRLEHFGETGWQTFA
jgi:hypothetical protein